jgi:hypothetical protein
MSRVSRRLCIDAVGRDRSPPHPTARADLACLQDAALDERPEFVVSCPPGDPQLVDNVASGDRAAEVLASVDDVEDRLGIDPIGVLS